MRRLCLSLLERVGAATASGLVKEKLPSNRTRTQCGQALPALYAYGISLLLLFFIPTFPFLSLS